MWGHLKSPQSCETNWGNRKGKRKQRLGLGLFDSHVLPSEEPARQTTVFPVWENSPAGPHTTAQASLVALEAGHDNSWQIPPACVVVRTGHRQSCRGLLHTTMPGFSSHGNHLTQGCDLPRAQTQDWVRLKLGGCALPALERTRPLILGWSPHPCPRLQRLSESHSWGTTDGVSTLSCQILVLGMMASQGSIPEKGGAPVC